MNFVSIFEFLSFFTHCSSFTRKLISYDLGFFSLRILARTAFQVFLYAKSPKLKVKRWCKNLRCSYSKPIFLSDRPTFVALCRSSRLVYISLTSAQITACQLKILVTTQLRNQNSLNLRFPSVVASSLVAFPLPLMVLRNCQKMI